MLMQYYCIIWIQENPILFRIIIIIAHICLRNYALADPLYCADENIDMSPNEGTEQESIESKYEKYKKRLDSYQKSERDGRKYQEYWHKIKDEIKLTRKERTVISKMFGVKLNDLEKALRDKNIEYFRDLRLTSRNLIDESKFSIEEVKKEHKEFFTSKGLNSDDYPL